MKVQLSKVIIVFFLQRLIDITESFALDCSPQARGTSRRPRGQGASRLEALCSPRLSGGRDKSRAVPLTERIGWYNGKAVSNPVDDETLLLRESP